MPSTVSSFITEPTVTYSVIHLRTPDDPHPPNFELAFHEMIGTWMRHKYNVSERDPEKAAKDGMVISRPKIYDLLIRMLPLDRHEVARIDIRLYLVKLNWEQKHESHRIFWMAGKPGGVEENELVECGFAIDPDYVGREQLQGGQPWNWKFLFGMDEEVKVWIHQWERDKTCPREVDPWMYDG